MVLLVRYGELALKSAYVRRQLEDRLAANVRDMFAANATDCIVRTERGRLFVHADDEGVALRLLRRVFGIVSVSPAREGPSDLESLTRDVVAYARPILGAGQTFAIRPRRTGNHPYTSQDLARSLGKAVQDGIPGTAVDLDAPDCEVHVEVRGPRAYVFHEVEEGPGGLPLGSQGEVSTAVEDERGMVSAWLMMRRGCRVRVAGEGAAVLALRRWDPRLVAVAAGSLPRDAIPPASRVLFAPPSPRPSSTPSSGLTLQPLVGLSPAEVEQLSERIRAA